jgi:hypothetical protein
MQKYLSPQEIAERYGSDPDTVKGWISPGIVVAGVRVKLRAVRVGKDRCALAAWVEEFLACRDSGKLPPERARAVQEQALAAAAAAAEASARRAREAEAQAAVARAKAAAAARREVATPPAVTPVPSPEPEPAPAAPLSTAQVAARYGYSDEAVRRWIDPGLEVAGVPVRLRAIRVGRHWRTREDWVAEFLAACNGGVKVAIGPSPAQVRRESEAAEERVRKRLGLPPRDRSQDG